MDTAGIGDECASHNDDYEHLRFSRCKFGVLAIGSEDREGGKRAFLRLGRELGPYSHVTGADLD